MLFEIAVGDAYGSEFEFAEANYVKKYNKVLQYYPDPIGRYTDDTQQSLAIAEAILEDDPWTPESLSQRFVDVFKRDPRFGYSKRMFNLLTESNNGKDFLEKIEPTKDSCGCVMRAVPLGLIQDLDEMFEKAKIQAEITHNHAIAVQSTQAVALISHELIYNGNMFSVLDNLQKYFPNINWKWEGSKVFNKAEHVARASLDVLCHSSTYEDILFNSVSLLGDVDSVSAIAMGCASSDNFLQRGMFSNKLLNLENEKYGKNYILEIDKKLEKKFNVKISGLAKLVGEYN